ncbi:hypothetical protein Tco_1228577 [Tanacetum coccineum]
MASLDHRLNPLFVIKKCSSCGALYTADVCCSKGGLEDKILVPKLPQNCATCGDPVNGLNCQSCAFMRKCLNEGWYTIHDENKILNTSKSSNHNTNVKEERRITEDQAAKDRYWKIPICYDDDEDYIIAITPVLSTKEPVDSLIMEDEHLDTIPAMESDEVIKSSVENLVPIPSESEGISDDTCDVPVCEDPSTFDALKDHSEILSDSNDDGTSSDDDDFEDIEYMSLEEVNDVNQEKKEFNLEDILQIQDVILREKLLNINRLIANIKSLNDNPTPNRVLNSPSPIPIEPDQGGLTSVVISDNPNDPLLELPQFESFHFDPSFPRPPPEPPDVEISLNFEPDAPVINNFDELNEDECFDPGGGEINVSQNVEDDDSFTFVIRTFLPFLTYPEDSPLPPSSGNEDTIFDPGISTFHFSSLKPVAYENPIVIFLFFCFCPKDKGIRGEIPQDHEDPCLFSILQSSGLRSFAYFGILNPDHVQRIENKAKTVWQVRGTVHVRWQYEVAENVRCQYEVLFQVAAGQSERDTWHLACVSTSEDECFIGIVRDLCRGLRLSLSKNRRLIADLEALGQRADAIRPLGYLREMVGRDSDMLGFLEQLLARAEFGKRLKAGYADDMDQPE